ncbi:MULTISPECIES: C40 family peptidase [Paenibacillus]|uniref:C40 family peptidase n=1 Tax=Paenibacillus TaxID=44249 RepID=UPI0008389918|nr:MULTISPECIES: C40 family peptidase [Paenibacillus]GIP24636.1 hypothetical protein J22TS3_49110 [Paenibacillus sp. J22TS3]
MRKQLTAAATSLALLFSLGTGSAFASSTLTTTVKSVYGTPYKTGGMSTRGFDCSGFTTFVFKKMGVSLARQSKAQFHQGSPVMAKSQLKAGDLVFFNTLGNGVSHVGVFLGNGQFAHASSSKGIHIDRLSSSYYSKRYVGAKRILSQAKYKKYAVNL